MRDASAAKIHRRSNGDFKMSAASTVTRRKALAAGLAAGLVATAFPRSLLSQTGNSSASLPRIDTHAHVFHRGLAMDPARRYTPDYDATLATYLKQLDDNAITHGVLVQPSFLGFNNSYIVECLKAANGRLRGIAVVEPSVSEQELKTLDQAGVVGIRLNLIGLPLPDFAKPEWNALIGKVAALGWQIEIQRKAGELAELAQALTAKGVTVVADHYGLPDPALGVEDPGFKALLALGSTGKVHVKVSAPYRNGANGSDFAKKAYPLLRASFGIERLMWGSDWPHTQFESTQTYAKNLAFLDELGLSSSDKTALLAAPKTLFRF